MTAHLPGFISPIILGVNIIIILVLILATYRIMRSYNASEKAKIVIPIVTIILIVGWFILALTLAVQGFFELDVNRVALGIFVPLVSVIGIVFFSNAFQSILNSIPQHWLIGIQIYRSVGIIFLLLFAQQKLPGIFAIPAGYGDILVGITAPFVAYWYFIQKSWSRGVAITWNIVGIFDLITAIGIGLFTATGPFRLFFTNPSTDIMSLFPLVLLPTFTVPVSILLHLFSLRSFINK